MPVQRLVHPDRLGDMDANGHSQLAAPFDKRAQARIVEVDAPSGHGTGIGVAQPLVHHLADAAGSQRMTALQLADGPFGPSGFAESRVVETAPEQETVAVGPVFAYILLEGRTDPLAVHDARIAYVARVKRTHPCGHSGIVGGVVVRMHVHDGEFGPPDIGPGNAEYGPRFVILQPEFLHGGFPFFEALRRHGAGGRNPEQGDGHQTNRFHRIMVFRSVSSVPVSDGPCPSSGIFLRAAPSRAPRPSERPCAGRSRPRRSGRP